jgi:hypothetical protein
MLYRVIRSPYLDFIFGIILILTTMFEVGGTLAEDLSHGNLRGEHGVALYGLLMIVRAVPDVVEGLLELVNGMKKSTE